MTKELFKEKFDKLVKPFAIEVSENNSLIELNDFDKCLSKAYDEYITLRNQYKDHIFPSIDGYVLDRHRLASCVCGAFLKSPVYNIDKLKNMPKKDELPIEVVFYYVNELIAFHAACNYLALFMANANLENRPLCYDIIRNFPSIPNVIQIKKGFLNCALFNLAQISDMSQIGLKHYDIYSYAMFFFHLEQAFYRSRNIDVNKNI